MSTNKHMQEQLSSLIDGEHADADLDFILASMGAAEKNDWEVYQRIGELLNSEESSVDVSADFSTRMTAALALEPTYSLTSKVKKFPHQSPKIMYAMAAMLAFSLIMVPEFAGQQGADVVAPYYSGQFSTQNSYTQSKTELAILSPGGNAENRSEAKLAASATSATSGTPGSPGSRMVRDPELDSYLAAHLRYSNSVYSAVEYQARPINPEVEK